MRLEHRATGRLGRVSGEDELDPQPLPCLLQRFVADIGGVE